MGFSRNSRIPAGLMEKFCGLDEKCVRLLARAAEKLAFSSRAYHSILRIARTVADLECAELISEEHVLEAIEYRRYGDGDFYWENAE